MTMLSTIWRDPEPPLAWAPWQTRSGCGHQWHARTEDHARQSLAEHGQRCIPAGLRCCTERLIAAPQAGQPVTCPDCGSIWSWPARDADGAFRFITPEHAAAIARPRWTAGKPEAGAVTVTYWRGSASLYFPVTDPASDMLGGSQVDPVECEHLHKTREAAETCGRLLAARIMGERNANLIGAEQQAAIELAQAGAHGGHGWDGDTCSDIPAGD